VNRIAYVCSLISSEAEVFVRLVYGLCQFCWRSDCCGTAYVTDRGTVGGWSVKKLILMVVMLSESDDV
jgi:hypothetical protein